MTLQIARFSKGDTMEWNDFVNTARNGLFLFNRYYMEYHEDRFTDHSLMVFRENKLVGVFPANEKNNSIWSHEGLTFGGILLSKDLRGTDTIEVLGLIMQYYKGLGFHEIYYKAIPYIFHSYPCQEDLYALFRQGALLYRRDISSVVALSDPIRFSETKRQNISKCIKAGAVFSENRNFGEYWELLKIVLAKFDASPVHAITEINSLHQKFPDKIRLFEARLSGELLAGIVIYDYNTVVHTQYMATSLKGRNIGALDFINGNLIEGEFKNRTYYSFGISTVQGGGVLNEGLIQQKEMMGGRAVVNDFYKIQLK